MANGKAKKYRPVIERIFSKHYRAGDREIIFERDEIIDTAAALGIEVAKNLGDVVYSFKYRRDLPESIQDLAPEAEEWRIAPAGTARYKFVLGPIFRIEPDRMLAETKIPDATPGIIAKYALSDEQALLAKVRYNRLVDIFTGITCYSLQNHLRTQVKEVGQLETDEVYIGLDRRGVHYVFPVQAKGGRDHQNLTQIEQDIAMCGKKFPDLVCRPIAAQFMKGDLLALFAFEKMGERVNKIAERHYRLVPKDEITPEDLRAYQARPEDQT